MRTRMRSWTYLANGKTLALDKERCVGCGLCLEACPHGVFRLAQAALDQAAGASATASAESARSAKAIIVAREACMECGACARNCPSGALRVRPGVGCALAVINGRKRGGSPDCGCGEESGCC